MKDVKFRIVLKVVWRISLLVLAIGLIWFTPEFQMLCIKGFKVLGISEFFGRPISNIILQQVFGLGFGVSTLVAQIAYWIKQGWKALFAKK